MSRDVRRAQASVIRLLRERSQVRWRDLNAVAKHHRVPVYWLSKKLRLAGVIRSAGNLRGRYELTPWFANRTKYKRHWP
jgi:hypothetical protein